MHSQDENERWLLDQLYRLAPLQVRGNPPYVYLEPLALDQNEDILAAWSGPRRHLVFDNPAVHDLSTVGST